LNNTKIDSPKRGHCVNRISKIRHLREALIHCPVTECPFRNEESGYYPQPSRGPSTTGTMMIFENPGNPGSVNLGNEGNPEMNYDINNISLAKALKFNIQGQSNWLFRTCRLNGKIWEKHRMLIGKTIYTTDVIKCPDPKTLRGPELNRAKKAAFAFCLNYLKEEISLIRPKVIFVFGNYARKAIRSIENTTWACNPKDMDRQRGLISTSHRMYILMPHPSGLWKNPPVALNSFEAYLEYAFRKAIAFRKKDSQK
jgi:uracil-DNA glycosylase family 4